MDYVIRMDTDDYSVCPKHKRINWWSDNNNTHQDVKGVKWVGGLGLKIVLM